MGKKGQKYVTESHKRHLRWLEYYNQIREDYRQKSPELFKAVSPSFFYKEVAEYFGHNDAYVSNVLSKLIKGGK